MLNKVIHILLVLVCLTSCTGPSTFEINGEVEGGGDFNVYVRYYAQGALQRGIMQVKDGKFGAKFPASEMALVELYDVDMHRLAILCLESGDKVTLKLNTQDPYANVVTDNPINQELLQALHNNADVLRDGSATEINEMVEQYIAEHPQSVVSTALFVTFYDASADTPRADSVMYSIDDEARLGSLLGAEVMQLRPFVKRESYEQMHPIKYRTRESDSTYVFYPDSAKVSLLVLSNEYSSRRDSVVPHIKRIYKTYGKRGLQVLDMGTFNEIHSWKGVTTRDSADWIEGWTPGGILTPDLKRLAIPSVPFYIVADSVGKQVYRGTKAEDAEAAIEALIGKK